MTCLYAIMFPHLRSSVLFWRISSQFTRTLLNSSSERTSLSTRGSKNTCVCVCVCVWGGGGGGGERGRVCTHENTNQTVASFYSPPSRALDCPRSSSLRRAVQRWPPASSSPGLTQRPAHLGSQSPPLGVQRRSVRSGMCASEEREEWHVCK